MIENTFSYSDKIHNYSFISNKLFDVTTVSLVLTLSYFSLLEVDLGPAGCDSCQKTFLKQDINLCKL